MDTNKLREAVRRTLNMHAQTVPVIYVKVGKEFGREGGEHPSGLNNAERAKVRQILQLLRDAGDAIHVGAGAWMRGRHTCPDCGEEKSIEQDFGLRRGGTAAQPYCTKCRSRRSRDPQRRIYKIDEVGTEIARVQQMAAAGPVTRSTAARRLGVTYQAATRVLEAGVRAGALNRETIRGGKVFTYT